MFMVLLNWEAFDTGMVCSLEITMQGFSLLMQGQ